VLRTIGQQPIYTILKQRVRGSSPWRRTTCPVDDRRDRPAKITGHFSPHPLTPSTFEDVGSLLVGQLAPKITILRHADLGVPELVTDLAGGHVSTVEEARDGLAKHVTDQALHLRLVADLPSHTRRTFDGSCQPPNESGKTGLSLTLQYGHPRCAWPPQRSVARPHGPARSLDGGTQEGEVQARQHPSRWP
jgi:hypothetical protein